MNDSHEPYFNQAFEEYIFNTIKEDDVVIIWRNSPAVVIGCYQNICREVDVYSLKKAGIPIIRRMSGGGTVYHDLGNINYTMICDKSKFANGFINYEDFLVPVINALNRLGIPAGRERSCDIAINGKKISGSAQKVSGGRVLHHGTLLFDSNLSLLDEITTKNKNENFISKASESAICQVTNIKESFLALGKSNTEYMSGIKPGGIADIDRFCKALLNELAGSAAVKFYPDARGINEIKALAEDKYKSWEWTWGKTPAFIFERKAAFRGRPVKISYSAKKGIITHFDIEADFIDSVKAKKLFEGARFEPDLFQENLCLIAEISLTESEELIRLMM